MKQTHTYTASQYVSDNGFPLSWMCRCCVSGYKTDRQEEAQEHFERTKSRPGTVVGRPAGREAYQGQSAMLYQQKSRGKTMEVAQSSDEQPPDATSGA
jgi:hypothetical protein